MLPEVQLVAEENQRQSGPPGREQHEQKLGGRQRGASTELADREWDGKWR